MVKVVNRADWGARTPTSRKKISVPVKENWLHHTAGSEAGAEGMRRIQNYHMDTKGWSDIGYSWVYDKDERTWYEGRGWGYSGAHTYGHNSVSHGLCVMGNFQNESVPQSLIDDVAWLVWQAHIYDKGPDKLTGGHRDVSSTACPGSNLYAKIPAINKRVQELLSEEAPKSDNESTIDNTGALGLVRIDSNSAVYHVVGEYLVPVTSPEQAEVLAKVHGGGSDRWQDHVVSISPEQAAAFTELPRASLPGGGEHSHDYAAKGHGHKALHNHDADVDGVTIAEILEELRTRLS